MVALPFPFPPPMQSQPPLQAALDDFARRRAMAAGAIPQPPTIPERLNVGLPTGGAWQSAGAPLPPGPNMGSPMPAALQALERNFPASRPLPLPPNMRSGSPSSAMAYASVPPPLPQPPPIRRPAQPMATPPDGYTALAMQPPGNLPKPAVPPIGGPETSPKAGNPLGEWFNSGGRDFLGDVLTDLGAGLASGSDWQEGLSIATRRSAEMQPQRQATRASARMRQEYGQRLRAMGPDYALLAEGVESGAMEPSKAWGEALSMQQEAAARGQQLGLARANAQFIEDPDLASLVASGALPVAEALRLSRQGGEGGATFGLTPIWGTDAQGNPVIAQLSNQGGVQTVDMPEGVTFGKDPIRMDAGNQWVLLDPVTRQQIGAVPKSGDIPTGFEQTAQGGVAPMEGSEQDLDRRMGANQAAQRVQAADERAGLVINSIDKALDQAGWWETGAAGAMMSAVPGSGAYNLRRTIDTIIANIGFNELQQMREMSPTGGALGQVAVQELSMLQSVIGSLDAGQSEEQLRESLTTIKRLLERQKMFRAEALRQRQQATGGNNGGGGGTTGTGVQWSFED